jgi:hypothetical protein
MFSLYLVIKRVLIPVLFIHYQWKNKVALKVVDQVLLIAMLKRDLIPVPVHPLNHWKRPDLKG